MKKFRHDDDKGFILLEILAGLIVIGIATPLIYSEIENWLNEQLYQSAASHADAYNTAARNYIVDNNATLHNGSLPANFTADDLIRKGYLKQGFNRSPFGQSYITGIRRNQTTGRLEALTCSTGGRISKKMVCAVWQDSFPGWVVILVKTEQQPAHSAPGQTNRGLRTHLFGRSHRHRNDG